MYKCMVKLKNKQKERHTRCLKLVFFLCIFFFLYSQCSFFFFFLPSLHFRALLSSFLFIIIFSNEGCSEQLSLFYSFFFLFFSFIIKDEREMKQFENGHILFFYYCKMENMGGLTDSFLLLLLSLIFLWEVKIEWDWLMLSFYYYLYFSVGS